MLIQNCHHILFIFSNLYYKLYGQINNYSSFSSSAIFQTHLSVNFFRLFKSTKNKNGRCKTPSCKNVFYKVLFNLFLFIYNTLFYHEVFFNKLLYCNIIIFLYSLRFYPKYIFNIILCRFFSQNYNVSIFYDLYVFLLKIF